VRVAVEDARVSHGLQGGLPPHEAPGLLDGPFVVAIGKWALMGVLSQAPPLASDTIVDGQRNEPALAMRN
jgi:hypothetical protein